MRFIDFQMSYNVLPQVGQDLYSQQVIQLYRDFQNHQNAKKVNILRDQTVVNLNQIGVQNKIMNQKTEFVYKKESLNQKDLKNSDITYEISFTKSKFKNNFEKGLTLDIII